MILSGSSYSYPGVSRMPPQGSGVATVGRGPIDVNIINGLRDSSGRQAVNSAFGELEVGTRTSDISLLFIYGISTGSKGDLIVSGTNGGWVIQSSGNLLTVTSSANINGFASARSIKNVTYRPGHEVYAYFTAQFHSGAHADNVQRVGLFDDLDGYYIGLSGSRFFTAVRNTGSDIIHFSESFTYDKLDGTGQSFDSFTLNPYKMNIYRVSTGWLGAAPPQFSAMNERGTWNTFHTVQHANLNEGTTTIDPHLPISAEIKKNGAGAANLQLKCASWAAGIVDGADAMKVSQRNFAFVGSKSGITTETNIFTLKSKSTFFNKNNKISAQILFLGAANGQGQALSTLYIRKNVTLGGSPSFIDIETTNSIMEVDVAGTTITGGNLELALPLGIDNNIYMDITNMDLRINPGETITFSVASSLNVSSSISTRWTEYF